MKSPNIRKNARWYISIVLFSISILSSLAISITILYMIHYLSPVDTNAKPTQLKIAPGMSSMAIANQLAHNKLIHNPWAFLFVTHLSGANHRLQVGTYCLSGAMSIPQIIDHLRTGKVVTQQFVVPEGLTVAQIGKLWEKAGFGAATAFNQAASDPKWRLNYKIKGKHWRVTYFRTHTNFPMEQHPR